MAITVKGTGRMYVGATATLGTGFGTHVVEEFSLNITHEAPVESQVAGAFGLVAIKSASKAELTATFVTTDAGTIPDAGTFHTLANFPVVEFFTEEDAINDAAILDTGQWLLTNVSLPAQSDAVARATATFVKYKDIVMT